MKFFFPDSQDQVDPTFDFETEKRSIYRVRQRDDLYAHEVLARPAYTGILVSKAIVDGTSEGAGKYTLAQRHRLYRLGVRRFFRLDECRGPRLETMGDCGAFTYLREQEPPFTVDDVIDFYDGCGFDYGLSLDHVILGFLDDENRISGRLAVPDDWKRRQALTIQLASDFLKRHRARKCSFVPVGVAQGWSPKSYAKSVKRLQRMGYRLIALGGMVPLKTHEVVACLRAVNDVRDRGIRLHLLGLTRCDHIPTFAKLGVKSFDSTSPFRQAFKDDRDNYHTPTRTFTALRVPQVEANTKLKKKIQAGEISQQEAIRLEARALEALAKFDRGRLAVRTVVKALREYELLYDGKVDHSEVYAETLESRPWKKCSCGICTEVGIDVVIFRGSERNKRRGFHNLYAFNRRLQRQLKGPKSGTAKTRSRARDRR